MNSQHKFRIGNQLVLTWMHYPNLTLGQLISNAIGDKKLSDLEDQELLDLIDKYYK